MSTEAFLHHWQVEHPPYVWALPGLRRYVQNPALQVGKGWPWDGLAELWFDSVRDVALAFDSPQAEPMRGHEACFIGQLDWFLTQEDDVPAPVSQDC
jgi:uncharacterized protein (TIGR02118 family)